MGNASGDVNRSDLAPATNVTKGMWKKTTGAGPKGWFPVASGGIEMPTHPCFDTDSCEGLASVNHDKFAPVLTDAEWAEYWGINHDGLNFANLKLNSGEDLDGDGIDGDPIDLDGDGKVSRWEMYNYETMSGDIPDNTSPSGGNSTETAENGNNKHYTGSGTPSVNRRLVSVAVVNCTDQGIKGNTSNSGKLIKPTAITKLFLVKPVPDPSVGHAIYVEVVGTGALGSSSSATLHDIIQLYR